MVVSGGVGTLSFTLFPHGTRRAFPKTLSLTSADQSKRRRAPIGFTVRFQVTLWQHVVCFWWHLLVEPLSKGLQDVYKVLLADTGHAQRKHAKETPYKIETDPSHLAVVKPLTRTRAMVRLKNDPD